MTVRIVTDEWYPVYTIGDDRDTYYNEIELSPERIEWIRGVCKDFDMVQAFLRKEIFGGE